MIIKYCENVPQSRQSAKRFFQSSELGLPNPLTRRPVYPHPGEGVDESQFRRGDIHWALVYKI